MNIKQEPKTEAPFAIEKSSNKTKKRPTSTGVKIDKEIKETKSKKVKSDPLRHKAKIQRRGLMSPSVTDEHEGMTDPFESVVVKEENSDEKEQEEQQQEQQEEQEEQEEEQEEQEEEQQEQQEEQEEQEGQEGQEGPAARKAKRKREQKGPSRPVSMLPSGRKWSGTGKGKEKGGGRLQPPARSYHHLTRAALASLGK